MSRCDKGRGRSVLLPVCLEKRKWMVKCRSKPAFGSGEGSAVPAEPGRSWILFGQLSEHSLFVFFTVKDSSGANQKAWFRLSIYRQFLTLRASFVFFKAE
jgi:hypothetical protein